MDARTQVAKALAWESGIGPAYSAAIDDAIQDNQRWTAPAIHAAYMEAGYSSAEATKATAKQMGRNPENVARAVRRKKSNP